jgi:hypothetical protein
MDIHLERDTFWQILDHFVSIGEKLLGSTKDPLLPGKYSSIKIPYFDN